MLVVCKICKVKNERDDSYKVVVNNKNNYYCSKDEYDSFIREKEYKDLLYKAICECFGYEIKNTALWKEIHELYSSYNYEVMYHTVIESKNSIMTALPKLAIPNEFNKIRYAFAFIKNNISSTEELIRRQAMNKRIPLEAFESECEAKFYETFHTVKPRTDKKKSIYDYIAEYDENEEDN